MSDGRVPLPSGLGGGSSAAQAEVDTTTLREAVSELLLCIAELQRPLSPFAKGEVLMLSPRFELSDLGHALLALEARSAAARDAARDTLRDLNQARRERGV